MPTVLQKPPSRPLAIPELLRRLRAGSGADLDVLVLGGGCAGLALATALTEGGRAVTVVDASSEEDDARTWCYWDTGQALLPEAVSMSWGLWEVRTPEGISVATDPDHPYRMVHARAYRAAARRRITSTGRGRVLDGVRVTTGSAVQGFGGTTVVDARGPGAQRPLSPGRVRLHQRFVGVWVQTTRPVFDTSTVTLMDFAVPETPADVRFFYVLPVAPDLALVEYTVFARSPTGPLPFREAIEAYLARRWQLEREEWAEAGAEAGSIPMTDQPSPGGSGSGSGGVVPFGMRAGIARPSTGYAFTRIQLAARSAALAFGDGRALPSTRDPWHVRMLDAIFLRFLRDQPELAPAVFLRMFNRLPGPLTVRFLTERSGLVDELRLILALPKLPFLRAAATTAAERLGHPAA